MFHTLRQVLDLHETKINLELIPLCYVLIIHQVGILKSFEFHTVRNLHFVKMCFFSVKIDFFEKNLTFRIV